MKRLLLSLCFVGAAVYTVNALFFTQTVVPNGTAEDTSTPAGQTQPNQPAVRQLRSWGPYLPGEPRSQKRQAPLATSQQPAEPPPQQNAAYEARPFNENPGQNLPNADDQPAAADKASLPGIDGTEQEPVEHNRDETYFGNNR